MCVSCTNGDQTITYSSYQVTQTMDCSITLSAKIPDPANVTFNYDPSTSQYDIGAPDYFFDNADSATCDWTLCELKASDCSTAYSGSELSVNAALTFSA